MIATTSGIQIATLVVAAVAVISSFAGPYYVARFSNRSEHRVWQRGVRMRVYSNLAQAADEYAEQLSRFPPMSREERAEDARALGRKISDVDTFGSEAVRVAAMNLLRESALTIVDESKEQTNATIHEVYAFRDAVRASLKIDDD
jgi:hypothetical protein